MINERTDNFEYVKAIKDIKELTYKEIILGRKGLRQLREENNLNIPEEYIKSSKKIMLMMVLAGILIGYTISMVIPEIIIKITN